MWKNTLDKQNGGFTRRVTQNYEQSSTIASSLWEGVKQEDSEYVWCWRKTWTGKCNIDGIQMKKI